MTAAIESVQVREDSDPQDQDKVILKGKAPQDVWVRAYDDGTKQFAQFGPSENGPWYRHGIKWKCPRDIDESMFITFHLVDVLGVDCDAPVLYSEPFQASNALEQYCAVPPSDTEVVYHCRVELHQWMSIDPKIVVTPITEPDPDGGASVTP